MPTKRYWRCYVCNDIHYGNAGPEVCPTCGVKHAYCEIDKEEAMNIEGDGEMNRKELRAAWEKFSENQEFMLNPDSEHVDVIIKGVTNNEKKYGLKLCPCRLRDGSRERDLELICPCNFKTHDTWREKGQCWCGLFVKRED